MLTKSEKKILENTMEDEIHAHPQGIDTQTLNQWVLDQLKGSIPNLNSHHIAGMLSWVYKHYGHTFLVKSFGNSVIV